MNENTQIQDCTRKCWMLSAVAGVVLAILLLAFSGLGFFVSILLGLVVFGLGGFLLKHLLCGNLAEQTPETEVPSQPVRAAAAPVADATPADASKEPVNAPQAKAPAAKPSVVEDAPATAPAAKVETVEAAPAKAPVAETATAPKAAQAAPKPARAPVAADGKPETLEAPRDGGPDDLKQIKGVGPKLEGLLNEMGIYHFSQVAGWRKKEVEWADQNLVGFKGRVSRDEWVKQAKVLAKGGSTEFSNKVRKGGVS